MEVFFFGVYTELMAYVMRSLGSYSRSCVHDVCRWYKQYRNARKDHSINKRHLVPDVVVHATWASRKRNLLSSESSAPNSGSTPVASQSLLGVLHGLAECLFICCKTSISTVKPRCVLPDLDGALIFYVANQTPWLLSPPVLRPGDCSTG